MKRSKTRGCWKKRSFSTYEEADAAMKQSLQAAQILGRRKPVRIYHCGCGSFHMTSKAEPPNGDEKLKHEALMRKVGSR